MSRINTKFLIFLIPLYESEIVPHGQSDPTAARNAIADEQI